MADKIRFNDNEHGSEYEPTDSEDDYSEEEKQLLKDVRESHKRVEDPKKQVLAFDETTDDDDEDDDAQQMDDSDIEGAADHERGLPNEMDWGDKSRNYYNTDFVDRDYDEYNEQEMEMAQQEEEEAKNIQQRLLKQMKEADFQLDAEIMKSAEGKTDSATSAGEATRVKADLRGLSKREQERLFQEDSPEFYALTANLVNYLEEQRDLVSPVLEYVKANNLPLIPAFKFARLRQQLLLSYGNNIAFYLLLKAKRQPVRTHPLTKRLLRLQLLLKELSETYETIIKPQLEALLERIQDGDKFEVLDIKTPKVAKTKTKLGILQEYEDAEEEFAAELFEKPATLQDAVDNSDSEDEQKGGEGVEEEDVDADEDTRRGITKQIAKNKGLTPHRKKELRNPRVKHRTKFRKALIRRKGAVRTVRKETKRYGGEVSGIKATVSKSIKFKV